MSPNFKPNIFANPFLLSLISKLSVHSYSNVLGTRKKKKLKKEYQCKEIGICSVKLF